MQEVLAVMKNQLGSIMLPQQADAARTEENARWKIPSRGWGWP